LFYDPQNIDPIENGKVELVEKIASGSHESEIWEAKQENKKVVVKRFPIKYQNNVDREELSKGPVL
jgi:hypothetical protein